MTTACRHLNRNTAHGSGQRVAVSALGVTWNCNSVHAKAQSSGGREGSARIGTANKLPSHGAAKGGRVCANRNSNQTPLTRSSGSTEVSLDRQASTPFEASTTLRELHAARQFPSNLEVCSRTKSGVAQRPLRGSAAPCERFCGCTAPRRSLPPFAASRLRVNRVAVHGRRGALANWPTGPLEPVSCAERVPVQRGGRRGRCRS